MDDLSGNIAEKPSHGYDFVESPARVAVYDDLLSSPRILDIEPAGTKEFINALATSVYGAAKEAGGTIPFSIILQVAENFIHARFQEMVVSVLDGGNTIRFADQGPGIADKDKAQQPGYSSATAPMKRYINGVGSGLPIVREYMETKHGTVRIEDNLNSGAVVTISLNHEDPAEEYEMPWGGQGRSYPQPHPAHDMGTTPPFSGTGATASQPFPQPQASDPLEVAVSMLSQRALQIMRLFVYEDIWGVKDISDETGIPASSTYSELKKLEEAGMMTRLGKKYRLTELGERVAKNLS